MRLVSLVPSVVMAKGAQRKLTCKVPALPLHMSHSLNSLKGVIWGVIYRGLLQGLLRGILGVETMAHSGMLHCSYIRVG